MFLSALKFPIEWCLKIKLKNFTATLISVLLTSMIVSEIKGSSNCFEKINNQYTYFDTDIF